MIEFSKRFLFLVVYAWAAACVSVSIQFLSFMAQKDWSISLEFFWATALAGGIGVLAAFPSLFLGGAWLWFVRDKESFMWWVSIPTLLALLNAMLYWEVLKDFNEFHFPTIFAFSGFLTSTLMWLTYRNKPSKDIIITTTHLTNVIKNASN